MPGRLTADGGILVKHKRAESLEKRLLAERARMADDLAAAEREAAEAGDGSAVVAVERAELAQIEKALLRLQVAPEQAGICRDCGRQISAARLALVPETHLCARHARLAEARSSP